MVKAYRQANGYSQKEFAEKLKVSNASVTRWETQTSKQSNVAVKALEGIGFGPISEDKTNKSSISRIDHIETDQLRSAIQSKIKINAVL